MSVIICGESGCGKTANAEKLCKFYKMAKIVDGWTIGEPIPENALILTNCQNAPGAIQFDDAMKTAGL